MDFFFIIYIYIYSQIVMQKLLRLMAIKKLLFMLREILKKVKKLHMIIVS